MVIKNPKINEAKAAGITPVRLEVAVASDKATKIASALGPRQVNPRQFFLAFNEIVSKTNYTAGEIVRVFVYIFPDRTFHLEVKGPSAAQRILQVLNLTGGAKNPGKEMKATVKISALQKIAGDMLPNMNARNVEGALKMLIGTAKSMGISFQED